MPTLRNRDGDGDEETGLEGEVQAEHGHQAGEEHGRATVGGGHHGDVLVSF